MITKKPKNFEEFLKLLKDAKENGDDIEVINANTGESGPEALDGLLEMVKRKLGGGDDGPKITDKLSGPALAHALLDVVANHAQVPDFEPGTFVRYRDDVRYVRDSRELSVVVEKINPPRTVPLTDENDGNCTVYRRYNLIIAKADKHGGVVRYLADSRELELFPDADKLMDKNS